MNAFELIQDSIIGRYHIIRGVNNQDSYISVTSNDKIIAVICDGCGSGEVSEVGANIGANILLKELTLQDFNNNIEIILKDVRRNVVKKIDNFSKNMFGSKNYIMLDYFLFTSIITVITKEKGFVASIGDGIVALNGEVKELGPFKNNAPPFIMYNAVKDELKIKNNIDFIINFEFKTDDLENLLISTDGLPPNIVKQFWEDDELYRNKNELYNRLSKLNKSFTDDTTLIAIRRKK